MNQIQCFLERNNRLIAAGAFICLTFGLVLSDKVEPGHSDQCVERITIKNNSRAPVEIYPESETNFFTKAKYPRELAFVKNDQGEVTEVIVGSPGTFREGKKLKNE
jgi:hypothetical protein